MSNPTQAGNVAGGHIAGRDVNITAVFIPPESRSSLSRLLSRFRQELDSKPQIAQVVDTLKHYMVPVDARPVGVEEKLTLAGRQADVRKAELQKELFNKRLTRHQFSIAAQDIFAFLLGLIETVFLAKIKPLLSAGAPKHEVDAVIASELVAPIMSLLEDNPIELTYQEVWGMLYYLTGNCHIQWHDSDALLPPGT